MRVAWAAVLCCLLPAVGRAAEPVDYLRDVKPILTAHCTSCHGADKQRSGLRLDTAAFALKGGNRGPAVVPGKADDSRLIKALGGADDMPAMPPKQPRLAAEKVATLRAWIDQGARAPADEVAARPAAANHWSFRPPVRTPPPAVSDPGWCRTPIDNFILARLDKEGVRPSPEADPLTLLRRVSLDLTGLPPTPQEIEEFLGEWGAKPQAAYEKVVDRLLASPHYGERWGRHWLDQARYADSNGFNIDAPRTIWPYRDWVINALNADMPFDQFTVEQLAGDLLPNATTEQKVATGFHRNTLLNQEGGIDVEQFRVESVVDRVNTTGSVFLGLTVGCCQCHDHKFDPITQKEYYQLFAFLNNADEPTLELLTPEQKKQRDAYQARLAALQKELALLDPVTQKLIDDWEKKLTPEERAALPEEVRTVLAIAENGRSGKQKAVLEAVVRRADETRHAVGGFVDPLPFAAAVHARLALRRGELKKQIAELKKKEPDVVTTLVMQERKTPRETHIHLGGDFLRKGALVTPGVPAVLHPLSTSDTPNRLDLARWIAAPANPLTPRVIVNRLWTRYFGIGIVETENDFGTQGTPPSHPELLDWLATEFVRQGYSLKAMHRLIVTSAVYRQASKARPELATLDPRNRLLARQARLRLEAEVVRDVTLSASGLLSEKIGGPSVFPYQPDGVYRFTQVPRDWKPSPGPDRYRRGLYTWFWRSAPHPGLLAFDAPDSTTACTRRNRSNTPLQALTLLNDQTSYEAAQALAGRVLREADASDAARLTLAFRLCLGRSPSELERKRLERLLAAIVPTPEDAKLTPPFGVDPHAFAAWTTVARVLLNLDEFITRE